MPALEIEIEQKSGLTLAEHFMQDKPTPLTRLWNLQLRLSGRFNSIHNKIVALQNEPLCPRACQEVSYKKTALRPGSPLV
jgi:hypothetical protein